MNQMPKVRVLVVEDEAIIAEDLKVGLVEMGYEVVGVAATAQQAIKQADEKDPDLVLMDVVLQEKMDGIEAANRIRAKRSIPVIYLTAYSDDAVLERAKVTEPFGYLIKPIRSRDLHTTIEMALFKNEMAKRLKESQEWFSVTLRSIADAVVATNKDGYVQFMNPVAEALTGWREKQAVGKALREVLQISDAATGKKIQGLVGELIRTGEAMRMTDRSVVVKSRDGSRIDIEAEAAPIRDDKGSIRGIVVVFRDITEKKETERKLQESHEQLEAYSARLEEQVEERTRALENSQEDLKKYSESLERTNEALKMIIEGVEEQKRDLEKKISHNLNLTVKPVIEQLKSQELTETASILVKSLEFNLSNLFSSFGLKLMQEANRLTPKEVRLCEMIRSGLSSVQMGEMLGISTQTVLVHRKNIRRKLGLARSKRNLTAYLKANF